VFVIPRKSNDDAYARSATFQRRPSFVTMLTVFCCSA
jgi:hypothetical protein